jgi:hypothetical protein
MAEPVRKTLIASNAAARIYAVRPLSESSRNRTGWFGRKRPSWAPLACSLCCSQPWAFTEWLRIT